jgi:hypothetical protein
MTKTLNQIIFFSSTKIRIFFSATLRIRIFVLEKTITPPSSLMVVPLDQLLMNYNDVVIMNAICRIF